jgi:hypothetical protein
MRHDNECWSSVKRRLNNSYLCDDPTSARQAVLSLCTLHTTFLATRLSVCHTSQLLMLTQQFGISGLNTTNGVTVVPLHHCHNVIFTC